MTASFQDFLYSTNANYSPQTRSQRGSNINSPFLKMQDSYNSESEFKCQQLSKMYEKRLTILKQSLNDAFGIVQSDNLLATMKNDVSSSEYAYERIKQIIEKCINDDREALVDKLCQEIADLKSDYFKLDQQNLKAASQYEDKIDELSKKTVELKEKYQNEQRMKVKYEDEAKDIQQILTNFQLSNEQALKKKEESIIKLKQEIQELSMYKDQNEKLEYMLEESDNKHKKLQQDYNQLSKEVIHLRGKSNEQDKNIDSLNSIIDEMQRIINESQNALKEKEKIETEYRCELDILQGKNEKLESSLAAMDNHEKFLKEEFNQKIEQIESEIINDRSNHEKTSATLENKYRDKIKQKQDKIHIYKDQLARYSIKIEELEKQLKEASEVYNKEKYSVDQIFDEQKRIHEQNIRDFEQECQRRIEDIKRRDHQEFVALQEKFEKMLEKVMKQTQEEANHRINQINEETKSLMQALQRKEDQLKRDYITLERHDKLMEEKTNLIERLKQEWVTREIQNAHEVEQRFKEQREKLTEDYNIQSSILKNCMADLERQILMQQAQKMESEKEIDFLRETNQNLKTIIKELEFENQKTLDNISEWSLKMEKLRGAYEEEQIKSDKLKQQLVEEARNHEEVFKHLNTVCEELTKKDKNMATLSEEFKHLETKYNHLREEHQKIEEEHQILRKESANRGNEQDIKINSLMEENKVLKENNKKLKDNLVKLTQEYEVKWEKVNSIQNQTVLELRKEEDQSRNLDFEIKVLQKQVIDLSTRLSETEGVKKELSFENEKLKVEAIELAREKEKAQKTSKKASTKLCLLKKQIENFVSSKICSMRIELRDLKKFYVDSFNLFVQDIELKIQNLLNTFSIILRQKADEYSHTMENIQRLMNLEAESLVDKTMLKAKQVQKDIVENYEHKCTEQERQIQTIEQINQQIKKQNLTLQEEQKIITTEKNFFKEENKEMRLKLSYLTEELNNKDKQFQKLKKALVREIDEKRKENADKLKGVEEEKQLMKEKYNKEVEELKSQLEAIKQKYAISLSVYEHKMNNFSLKQFEEVEELENSYKESLYQLQLTLDDTILGKEKLIKEAELLKEKNNLLQKKAAELERVKKPIENLSDQNSKEYEENMQKLRVGLLKDNYKGDIKKSSAEEEISLLNHGIQRSGKVGNEKDISDLAFQNENIRRQISDLEDRILTNNKFIQEKTEKMTNYPDCQSPEDIMSSGVISPNYIYNSKSPYFNKFRWNTTSNPTYNLMSPKLYTGKVQYASKTPKIKSYFLDQETEKKIFSERESMHIAFKNNATK